MMTISVTSPHKKHIQIGLATSSTASCVTITGIFIELHLCGASEYFRITLMLHSLILGFLNSKEGALGTSLYFLHICIISMV